MQYSSVGTGSAEMQKRIATSNFKLKFRFERNGGCYLYGTERVMGG
jgi:hypothetical protein